jgi:hypothetical protein
MRRARDFGPFSRKRPEDGRSATLRRGKAASHRDRIVGTRLPNDNLAGTVHARILPRIEAHD